MNKTLAPRLIAIVGGSGSGKTWLTARLLERLGDSATRVPLDYFYRDRAGLSPARRAAVNYDHPRAIDWRRFERFLEDCRLARPARLPQYDFQTHTRAATFIDWQPRPLVLFEGLWLLARASVRALFDYSIYLDCPAATRLRRRLERDVSERGRTAAGVRRQFTRVVAPMHERFVAPQQRHADLVLRQPLSPASARRLAVYLRCWLSHWALNPASSHILCRPPSFRSLTVAVNHE